jgi:hypothetical protein
MKRFALIAITILALGPRAACGNSQGERALSGAGIGAGTGAAGAALTGGSVAGGALIGGAAGAAIGALTDEEDLDLGEPIWK